ncbi:hypothetical protein [Teredinibacter sp. KSP-S5-2]|uniref:hypothetical protein n=1 Tax=Teredinibacter sp. KSP-S5-2 TaxID=3034506 RepID=UPI002934C948|nr:hypothetical protein [Teredinibacter sp. KSP-S5-2]WNO08519.1 hypothetical protein P5V12_16225 [Teredinibacter sp. KSP-S5-2]
MSDASSTYVVEEEEYQTLTEEVITLRQGEERWQGEYTNHYNWFYLNSPYPSKRIFTLRLEQQASPLIGTQGLFTRNWKTDFGISKISVIGDMYVAKAHRTLGPALKLLRHVTDQACQDTDIIYSFPNKNAEPVFKRIGYKKVNDLTRYSRPLRCKEILQSHQKLKMLTPFSRLIDFCLFIELHLRGFFTPNYNVDIQQPNEDELNDLWVDANMHYSMIGKRDAAFIKWRLANHTKNNTQLAIIRKQCDNTIQSYVIFETDAQGHIDIDDILCRNGAKQLKSMLVAFLLYAYGKKIKTVSFVFSGNSEIKDTLSALRMHPRESKPVYCYASSSSPENALINFARSVFITTADQD